jgi:hypothetical protein
VVQENCKNRLSRYIHRAHEVIRIKLPPLDGSDVKGAENISNRLQVEGVPMRLHAEMRAVNASAAKSPRPNRILALEFAPERKPRKWRETNWSALADDFRTFLLDADTFEPAFPTV